MCNVTIWLTNNYNTHIAQSRSKSIQALKFGIKYKIEYKIEYNKINIFLQKSCRK